MTYGLLVKAERIAEAAKSRRLQDILIAAEEKGLFAEAGPDSVTISGRRVVKTWIGDPLLRFAGRIGR